MKNVLILTCSTGEGHNSAARAIESALKRRQIACEIRDPVSFKSSKMERIVSGLYNDTIRKAPGVFGAVYRLGDMYSQARLPSPVYWANSRYSQALKTYILEHRFDAVICTHLYGMEAMTAIARRGDFSVPCFGVLTDYVCIPFLDETELTGFFVPTEQTQEYLIRRGIPQEKIIISGIPVDEKFQKLPSRDSARRALEIPEGTHAYLIMTGGVGCENMENLCRKLLYSMDEDDLLLVLTGKNEGLKKRLNESCDRRCKTVGFTHHVELYMAACDVMLSKPGGLSTTEAAVANIPMVHIHAIPGCETYNAQYFSSHGMALRAENDTEAVIFATELACESEKAEVMREMQRKLIRPDAAEMIVEEVEKKCIRIE